MDKQKHIDGRLSVQAWGDLQAFLKETFEALGLIDEIEFTADQLSTDLEAHFKIKYPPALILKLLETNFKKANRVIPPAPGESPEHADIYLFKCSDFIKQPVKTIGEDEV